MKTESSFGPSALATPANAVTLARLAISPIVLVMIASGGASWPALGAWVVLTASDGIDGYIARRQGTTSSGAFLDPLADKVLVLGGLFALVARGDFSWIPVVIITAREVVVSGYRSWGARRGVSMPARRLGKWKATVQYLAVAVALFPPTADHPGLADAALWVAVALTVVSGIDLIVNSTREPAPHAL